MVVVSCNAWVQNASSPAGPNNNNNNNSSAGSSSNSSLNNQNSVQSNNNNNNNNANNNTTNNNKMTAKGVLICRDNSHPFQERTLTLEQPVKIGRSVARARAAPNNAIFDCKVLSRNHALLWYSSGKFYLQDTSSSNGTFVNNQRLSASGLESTPKEVCSGDIVQFGVDVVESTKKVTHGCIVATLKLYLPDGKEAKASLSTSVSSPAGNVSLEDLYKLNQVMQEASRREKALYNKLGYLQQLVENTRKAANQSWKALITEDRLLSWVVTVENQLAIYSKNYTEDKIRNELARLQDEKAQYQNAAKEALQKILQEKLEVTQKLVQLEGRLNETEEECQSLHNVAKYSQSELQELSAKYTETQRKLHEITDRLAESEERVKDLLASAEQERRELTKRLDDQSRVERGLRARLRDSRLDSVNTYKQITALRNYAQTLQDMNLKLEASENLVDAKAADYENPIEAINAILNTMNSIHVDNIDVDQSEISFYPSKNEQQDNQQLNSPDADLKQQQQLKSSSNDNDTSFEKDQDDRLTQAINDVDEDVGGGGLTEYILPPPRSSSRRTLVNGNPPVNLDNSDANADSDTSSSEATDDTSSAATNDDNSEKSMTETTSKDEDEDENQTEEEEVSGKRITASSSSPCDKTEVRFADEDDEERVAVNDNDTFVSRKTIDATLDKSVVADKSSEDERDEADVVVDGRTASSTSEEQPDGDYVNTLKPALIRNDAMMTQQTLHSRDYALQTLIASLDSLQCADMDDDGLGARQVVERELEELRSWLLRESRDQVIGRLTELYYRAKNDAQRTQEVNEELVLVKEKYNVLVEEKTAVSKRYTSLREQCGDLGATYNVPIHYVVPIVLVLVCMLLEKIF